MIKRPRVSSLLVLLLASTGLLSVLPGSAKIVYVAQDATGDGSASSWADAFTTISAGLAA